MSVQFREKAVMAARAASGGSVGQPKFVEQIPREEGFAAVFQTDIAPGLRKLEGRRLKLREQGARAFAWIGGSILFGILIVLIFVRDLFVPLTGLLIVGAGIASVVMTMPQRRYRVDPRDLVLPPVLGLFPGLGYARTPDDFPVQPFVAFGLTGSPDKVQLEDVFLGNVRGLDFAAVEARLDRFEQAGAGKALFRGTLFVAQLPRPILSRAVIAQDLSRVDKSAEEVFANPVQKMLFADLDFADRFDVLADDPDEMRDLLNARVCKVLTQLADRFATRGLQAVLAEDRLYLLLPKQGGLFEYKTLFRSLYEIDRDLHALIAQLDLFYALLDALSGDRTEAAPVAT